MSYDEIGVRLGEVLMRYGLDQLARRQDAKLRQEEYAQERQARMQDEEASFKRNLEREAKYKPPARETVQETGEDGKTYEVTREWRIDPEQGGSYVEVGRAEVKPKVKGVRNVIMGDEVVTATQYDDGTLQPVMIGDRESRGPRRMAGGGRGGAGGGERSPKPPKKILVQDRRSGKQRWILEGDPIGDNEFVASAKAFPERAAPRSRRDEPGMLDRLAGAAESFADAAQRQAGATEKAEKPVQVRTDKHGRKWNIYADGTMELAEP